MSRAVSWLRDVAAVISTITTIQGRAWIPIINTTTGRWHILDGATPGGIPMARLDDVPGQVPTTYASPSTGTTVTAAGGTQKLQLTPNVPLATLTIELPPTPVDDAEYAISTTQQIAALTVTGASGGGATVSGGTVGTLSAHGGVRFRYRDATTTWYRAP